MIKDFIKNVSKNIKDQGKERAQKQYFNELVKGFKKKDIQDLAYNYNIEFNKLLDEKVFSELISNEEYYPFQREAFAEFILLQLEKELAFDKIRRLFYNELFKNEKKAKFIFDILAKEDKTFLLHVSDYCDNCKSNKTFKNTFLTDCLNLPKSEMKTCLINQFKEKPLWTTCEFGYEQLVELYSDEEFTPEVQKTITDAHKEFCKMLINSVKNEIGAQIIEKITPSELLPEKLDKLDQCKKDIIGSGKNLDEGNGLAALERYLSSDDSNFKNCINLKAQKYQEWQLKNDKTAIKSTEFIDSLAQSNKNYK